MPRPRATNPLNLPPRVAFKHGAFYYRHRDGRWERLGTDIEQAKARGRHYADATSQHGTMAWYFDEWLAWLDGRVAAGKLAPRTREDYDGAIVPLKAYLGKLVPTDITPVTVQEYLDLGVELNRPVRTNREKAALSACLTWIRTRRPEAALRDNPCFGVRRNAEKPDDHYVEDADYAAVLKRASPMIAAYAELVYRTLQRPSDVLGWTRANLRTRTVTEAGVTREQRYIKTQQNKTGAELEIELDDHLLAVLGKIKRDVIGLPLIHRARRTKDGAAGKDAATQLGYTEDGVASMWRRWCHLAKVPTFGVGHLRGKGATDMYRAGIPLEKIQALMGHESVTTTEIYIKRRLKFVAQPNKVGHGA